MIKKLCATGLLTAAVGVTVTAAPAHADRWSDNWSTNTSSWQAGNLFSRVGAANHGWGRSVNVNNLNGYAFTAAHGSTAVTFIFF
ncbi:hypothetical protein OUY22_34065 [Nonomuraea sp. MCN248]|uniref:Lactococcin 972 family bacteriocin n=1 Tax=Nonomuraea corallina TaxID=2989783 RepID=A0ABT4SN74_9ACTN|nr:hypothetical protein [Nonomuraea corallina]MDA0638460.1 hypothetical protein [Nonomuraea corallina]